MVGVLLLAALDEVVDAVHCEVLLGVHVGTQLLFALFKVVVFLGDAVHQLFEVAYRAFFVVVVGLSGFLEDVGEVQQLHVLLALELQL